MGTVRPHVYLVKPRDDMPAEGVLVETTARMRSALAELAKCCLIVETPTPARVLQLIDAGVKPVKLKLANRAARKEPTK